MMCDQIVVWLNGEALVVAGPQALLPVSVWLRSIEHLSGTKVACGTGDCGACTILVARPHPDPANTAPVRWQSLNSCVRFVFQLHGCHVVTVEGLASAHALAPAQRTMMACHASQCGFCTPGFALTMTAALQRGDSPVQWRDALAGNVCRCTGYSAILEAADQAHALAQASGESDWLNIRFPAAQWQPEAIVQYQRSLAIPAADMREGRSPALHRPGTVLEALELLAREPRAQLVAGATDIGVDGLDGTRAVISIDHLTELAAWSVESTGSHGAHAAGAETLALGALTRWHDLPDIFVRTAGVHAATLAAWVARFGGPQIRAAGTVGGNIMTASSIGDMLPLLLALNASVELRSVRETRVVALDALLTGFRTTGRRPDELLTRVLLPLPRASEQLRLEKVSRRYDVDISTVSLAARWRDDHGTLRDVHLAAGGMGPVAVRLAHTETLLNGAPNSSATWAAAAARCHHDVTPRSDVRGSASYRSLVLQTLITQLPRASEVSA